MIQLSTYFSSAITVLNAIRRQLFPGDSGSALFKVDQKGQPMCAIGTVHEGIGCWPNSELMLETFSRINAHRKMLEILPEKVDNKSDPEFEKGEQQEKDRM